MCQLAAPTLNGVGYRQSGVSMYGKSRALKPARPRIRGIIMLAAADETRARLIILSSSFVVEVIASSISPAKEA